MDEDHIAILRTCSLLQGMSDSALALLAARTANSYYAANEQIFAQGDEGDEMLMVIKGRIKIIATSLDGREIIINTIDPGGVFGELALIDSEPRSASAVAAQSSRILRLHRRDLIPVLAEHPDLSLSIMRELSRKLRKTTTRYEELMFLNVEGRLARWLGTFAKTQSGVDHGAFDLRLEITQEEIGQMIGATREHVNKVLHRWKAQGLIEMQGRQIHIFDIERIMAQCEP